MPIRNDLRTWLIRELRRRIGVNPDRLSEEIRRLIDYPPDLTYRDPNNRGLIPGRLGVGLRTPREIPSEFDYELERGLALVDTGGALKMFASTALSDEWAEDPAPDWGWVEAHAQGLMSSSAYACALAAAPDWAGAPVLDPTAAYQSRATDQELQDWINDNARDSALCSGLMMLLVEAWGPFQDVAELKPTSWPDWAPHEYGVVRIWDIDLSIYRWWLVYLGMQGCRAIELQLDPLVTCLVDGLANASPGWPERQKRMAEAWILRAAFIYEGDEGQELITAQQMQQATKGSPLKHGYKFCPQRWDSGIENLSQASIINLELVGEAYDSQQLIVDFSLVAGNLQADLTEGETGRVHFGSATRRHPVWVESGGQLHAIKMDFSAPADVTELAPCYLVDYDDGGTVVARRIKEEAILTPAEPGRTGTNMVACTDRGPVSESWWRTATNLFKGGVIVGPVNAGREAVVGSGEFVQRVFELKSHGTVIDVVTTTDPDFNECSSCDGYTNVGTNEAYDNCDVLGCDYPDNDHGFTIVDLPFGYRAYGVRWAQGSEAALSRFEHTYQAGNYGGTGLIIPAKCATAVFVVSGQTTDLIEEKSPGGQRTRQRPLDAYNCTRNNDFLPGTSGYLFSLGRFRGVGWGWADGAPQQEPVCRPGNWIPINWSSCAANDPEGACAAPVGFETVESHNNVEELEAHLVTGHGSTVLQSDWSQWAPFLVASTSQGEIRAWSPDILVQFGGDTVYQDVPNGSPKSSAGHDPQSVADAIARRFVCS